MSAFRDLMITGLPVYTVAFDYGDIPEQRIRKNKLVVKPADPSKANYDFTGWFTNGVQFDFNTPVTEDLFLTAGWSLKTFTVSFDANGGNVMPPQVVAWGNKAAYVPGTRSYCNFTGWTLNGVAFDFNTPITGNITLTAQWQPILYTQSGNANVYGVRQGVACTFFCVSAGFNPPFVNTPSVRIGFSNFEQACPFSTYDFTGNIVENARYDSFVNQGSFSQNVGCTGGMGSISGRSSGTYWWSATGYYV